MRHINDALPPSRRAPAEPHDSRVATLGAQVWFDVPSMICMLALGVLAIVFDHAPKPIFESVALIAVYSIGTLTNLSGRLARSRSRVGADTPSGRGMQPHLLNFLLDACFTAGTILLIRNDQSLIVLSMLVLAGARYLANTSGGKVLSMLALLLLPGLLLIINSYFTPGGDDTGDAAIMGALLVVCLLGMIYAVTGNINRYLAERSALTKALADQEQSLLESRLSAEEDARRLAKQVLRLDLLQDGIRAINSAIDLDTLLQKVVNNAVRVLNAEQSSIGLIDPQTSELVIQCATGVDAAELRRRRFQPGVGVAGWVVENSVPLVVADVMQEPRYLHPYDNDAAGRTTRSMICVPLFVEGRTTGTLCVTHSEPNALTGEELGMLTAFAEQAALALYKSQLLEERTRQSEELRRRGDLIASLHSIGQSVLSSLDLSQALNTIISRISELSSFDHVFIYLSSERTGMPELVAASRTSGPPPANLFIAEGTPAAELWDRARSSGTVQDCTLSDSCILCLPMINMGRPLGCILLARRGDTFSSVERDTAEKLADAAAIAVVNTRLFSKVLAGQQQTDALYRLMLKVNAAPNRRQLASVICQELHSITDAKGSMLLTQDAEQARFTPWATAGSWAALDTSGISIPAQGDPFLSSVLTGLHQPSTTGLLIIENLPAQVRAVIKSTDCITIPLAHAGRIHGLFIIEQKRSRGITDDLRETLSLALSHGTVALERAELFEQTLDAARQSSMLYSIAAEVQTSLDQVTVVQMTVNGAVEALPVQSCEVYIFDDDHTRLVRAGMATAPGEGDELGLLGPPSIEYDHDPTLLEALRSPGLVLGDVGGVENRTDSMHMESSKREVGVVLGRLMGSEEPLGILRLTTYIPAEEFVQRHATFCQTLLTHSGGALERSTLFETASNQARMLRQRAQQLTDILNLGSVSAANVPLSALMPKLAVGIARSLGCAYVAIGETGANANDGEVWASTDASWAERLTAAARNLTLDNIEQLLELGKAANADVPAIYLEEGLLESVAGARIPSRSGARGEQETGPLLLMLLKSTGGATLGYILVAFGAQHRTAPRHVLHPDTLDGSGQSERDLLDITSIFAQRVALIVQNHRVYDELLESNRKMESIVLSISDGVIVVDPALNILITNSLADRLLGVEPATGRGLPLPRLMNNAEVGELVENCIGTSQPGYIDVDLMLDREMHTYQAVAHPIGAPDLGVLGAVLTLRDVSVERAVERAKSDFLSIVSHELRTPLNSVMGFLDIILMGKTGPLNDLQADFLGTAKQEAVVLQRLINDLLDYSQLQSGMLRMEMSPVNLSAVIARVTSQAVPRMSEDVLTLLNNVPPDLVVVGDEIRLEQVFRNLLDNAAKFTEAGGTITFSAEEGEQTICVRVSDNGCGVPQSQLDQVFNRFFQAANSSSRHKRGLGLGLSICKNIVEAHGGRIWIESELNIGTTVHVELLLFQPNSPLYDFDDTTGRATLNLPLLETAKAER